MNPFGGGGGGGKKGGGGGGSSVDPSATAAAQSLANKEAVRESALVNQINEQGPFGNVTYSGSIGSPDRTRTTTLTPSGQEQLGLQNEIGTGLLGVGSQSLVPQAQEALGQPLTFDGSQQISGAGDLEGQAQRLEDATYQRGLNRIQPSLDMGREREYNRLAQQGIAEGGQAWNRAIGDLDRREADQLENLSLSSVAAGRAEQSRLSGLEQQIRQQQINEQLTQRGQPINELSALLQGAPAIGPPQFQAPQQYAVQPADYYRGLELQAGLNNASQNRQSALTGGLIGAAGNIGAAFLR